MHRTSAVKLSVGSIYLVGASLLLPGFVWIAPTKCVPYPMFSKENYAPGIHLIIVGISLILVASLCDLVRAFRGHGKAQEQASKEVPEPHGGSIVDAGQSLVEAAEGQQASNASALMRFMALFGPICMVVGSTMILLGCILYLPRYSLAFPPKQFFGTMAPTLAERCFQVGSCVYLLSALTAIAGTSAGIGAARRQGSNTCGLWLTLLAFSLFIPTSTLFFANGFLPTSKCIEAGDWRMAATACLFSACALLFLVTLAEAMVPARASKVAEGRKPLAV